MRSELRPPRLTLWQCFVKTLSVFVGGFVLLCFAAIAAVIYFVFVPHEWGSSERFEKAAWHDAGGARLGTECVRGEMYADLKKNYLKPNTPKADVIGLLGKPDDGVVDAECITYFLGMCALIDGSVMNICFDSKEKITAVSHHEG